MQLKSLWQAFCALVLVGNVVAGSDSIKTIPVCSHKSICVTQLTRFSFFRKQLKTHSLAAVSNCVLLCTPCILVYAFFFCFCLGWQCLYQPYLDSHMQSRWFDYGGDTVIRVDQYIRLTADRRSQSGYIFSRVPLTATNWEVMCITPTAAFSYSIAISWAALIRSSCWMTDWVWV